MKRITKEQALAVHGALVEAGFDALVEANPRGVNMYDSPGAANRYLLSARIGTSPTRALEMAEKLTQCQQIGIANGLTAWFDPGFGEDRESYGLRVVFES